MLDFGYFGDDGGAGCVWGRCRNTPGSKTRRSPRRISKLGRQPLLDRSGSSSSSSSLSTSHTLSRPHSHLSGSTVTQSIKPSTLAFPVRSFSVHTPTPITMPILTPAQLRPTPNLLDTRGHRRRRRHRQSRGDIDDDMRCAI